MGGAAIIAVFLYTFLLLHTRASNTGLFFIYALLLAFPLVWYVCGCWWLWGSFSSSTLYPDKTSLRYNPDNSWAWEDFLQTDCAYPYWFVFWLVVTPLGILGLVVGILVLGLMVLAALAAVFDDE